MPRSTDEADEHRAAFGRRLRDLRQRAGMTQQALAEAVGIDRSFISDVETGRHSIAVDRAYQIAAALGVSISDLFTTA
ncbi:MAG TPA: helix-turn-helix transcriptional regulator [Micromonosporaceae bacterium]|nr:helix-turn-helix transcriptional regulator [Micromonosporaceae bacterium]